MVKKAKIKKGVTNDDLARMFQNQFVGLQADISSLQNEVRGGFKEVRENFTKNNQAHKLFVERFDKIDADLKDIKQEQKSSILESRLQRLEYKVGINKLEDN